MVGRPFCWLQCHVINLSISSQTCGQIQSFILVRPSAQFSAYLKMVEIGLPLFVVIICLRFHRRWRMQDRSSCISADIFPGIILGSTWIPRYSLFNILLDLGGCAGKSTSSGVSPSDESTDTALSRMSFSCSWSCSSVLVSSRSSSISRLLGCLLNSIFESLSAIFSRLKLVNFQFSFFSMFVGSCYSSVSIFYFYLIFPFLVSFFFIFSTVILLFIYLCFIISFCACYSYKSQLSYSE